MEEDGRRGGRSGEEIADVETDKATMPMEAFDDGTLAAVLVAEGEKVQVGQILAVLAGKGEDVGAIKQKYARRQGGGGGAPHRLRLLPRLRRRQRALRCRRRGVRRDPGEEGHMRPEATVEEVPQEQRQPSAAAEVEAKPVAPAGGERVAVSPLAKRMAAELGVELSKIQGTGPGGRIVQKDIEAAAAGKRAAPRRACTGSCGNGDWCTGGTEAGG